MKINIAKKCNHEHKKKKKMCNKQAHSEKKLVLFLNIKCPIFINPQRQKCKLGYIRITVQKVTLVMIILIRRG